jgi:hypothetical protein
VDAGEKAVQLMILKNDREFVCRKERISCLKNFLEQPEGHLFKGRLQLDKYMNRVTVIVKGEPIGTTDADTFKSSLR